MFEAARSAQSKEKGTPPLDNGALMPPSMKRCTWLLTRLLAFDSTNGYGLFAATWEQMHGHDTEKDLEAYFSHQRSLPRNIERYKEVQMEGQSLEKMQKAERDYFRGNALGCSIAKKLTAASIWCFQCLGMGRKGMSIADSRRYGSGF